MRRRGVHKIADDGKKTACGILIWKEPIDASRFWEDVTCRKCNRQRPKRYSPHQPQSVK